LPASSDVVRHYLNSRDFNGAKDAFHVVVPSLPGFAFSAKPKETGWNLARIAKAWVCSCSGSARAVGRTGENGDEATNFLGDGNAYFRQQSTRPQTIGYALADSPAG